MLRNKKYGMGGAVQSFSSPMLAQGMQGGLSGFGTSGLGTFAKGGRMSNVEMSRSSIKDWYKKNYKTDELGDEINPNVTFDDLFEGILNGSDIYSLIGVYDSVVRERLFSKLSKIKGRYENYANELYLKYGQKPLGSYAKGGEIIDQYEGRTPADIWFNLSKSQRRHLLLDHANIPSGEISMYVGYDTNYDDLPHFVKQIVKKHFAEGQYAKGGQIASIGDSGIITDKNSMFVGKMATITGDLGNMFEVRVGGRTTMVKKNGIRIVSDEYADGGKTRKSGNVPRIAKKVAEVNALIEKGNQLGLEVVDSSSTWQSPMKYKPIKYVNGILYIEYEKLDLYALSKRGVQKWDIQKDKVLKRNMEFDNPLNDIAKMYRKAIREREQYFADGGEITHLPEATKVSKENIEQFVRYVDSFYGKNGVYADYYEGVNSKAQIRKAVMTYLNKLDSQQTWGGGAGDSLDRERVGQILKLSSKPTYAKGGKISSYEVELEAVPNRDFSYGSHEAKVRVKKSKKSANSIEQAVTITKQFIQENDLGGSNFIPAKIYKNGKHIGFISYNGRVWNNEQSEMKYAEGGKMNQKPSKYNLGDKVFTFYNPSKSAPIVDLYFKAWDTLGGIPHENDTYFYELSLPNGEKKKLAESALSLTPLQSQKAVYKSEEPKFIEYKGSEIMYEPTMKKYYANDVEFNSLKDAQKFLDSGKISSNIRGAYQRGLFAKGGQTKAKRSRITLIMDGKSYSYPVAIVNGRVETTEETFKDGVVREYLDKEFDSWLDQAPSDYEEMYYGDESIMSKRGAIEGAMEIVISTIEEEAPRKTTFNFDEGDVEFYEAYQYARGGEVEGRKFYTIFSDEDGDIKTDFDNYNDALADFNSFVKEDANIKLYEISESHNLLKEHQSSADIEYLEIGNGSVVVTLEKVDGKWEERDVLEGEKPYGWGGKRYMGYLKPIDILRYLNNDYGGGFQIIEQYGKGGKIGFEGLAKKVAKRYVGKKVSKEYQAEYGKTYDAKEAKEVGNKVAGKVYQQQVAKKKIVRKLQRKSK
jgi:hypothetical protein